MVVSRVVLKLKSEFEQECLTELHETINACVRDLGGNLSSYEQSRVANNKSSQLHQGYLI